MRVREPARVPVREPARERVPVRAPVQARAGGVTEWPVALGRARVLLARVSTVPVLTAPGLRDSADLPLA